MSREAGVTARAGRTTIAHLADAPGFAATIADGCWHEWWSTSDLPLARYRAGIEGMAVYGRLPSAFVACRGDVFAGSVLLIADDLPAHPALMPWIAALRVEPAFRRRGIAARLIGAARAGAAMLGHRDCYLNATAANVPYYEARGFQVVERAVGDVDVLSIPASAGPPA